MSAADDRLNGSDHRTAAANDFPFERSDSESERLAAGFAEHVVRWAKRLQTAVMPGSARHPVRLASASTADDLSILRRCAHATSLATSNGHVCVLLSDLAGPLSLSPSAGLLPSPSPFGGGQPLSPSPFGGGQGWGQQPPGLATLRTTLIKSGVVGTPSHPGSLPLVLDEDGRLYLHRYFDHEVRLARRLMQAAQTPPRDVTPAARDLLDSLFPAANDHEVDWQKIAAAMALRGSLTVISGGPGTGKTTTVVNLLACLLTQEPHTRVALAAPTGKAAARMTEAIRQRADHLPPDLRARLPQESFTIHRLLGANPGQGRFTHDANNPLAIDALIVDEASMLDLALATRLLEAVPASARIILLGDKDQLAAVEAGAVFAELSADPTLTETCRRDLADLCGYAPERIAPPAPAQASPLRDVAVWLTKNYRFPADSAIAKLARSINEGRAEEALALLRGSRSDQPRSTDAPHSQRGPGRSNRANADGPAQSKVARKPGADTTSLPLFPELEHTRGPEANTGRPSAQARDTSIQWLDPERGDNSLDAILAGYGGYFEAVRRDAADVAAVTSAFAKFRVLCAVREGGSGSVWVNEQVTRRARELLPANERDQARDPRSPWYAGRPVMVLRNDYVNKLFNGDIGIALPVAGELAVIFPEGEDGFRSVPIARMPPHETAFAMTVHKAQGSEFESVFLLLPSNPSRVVVQELLYTAITRAKRSVVLSARSEAIAQAVRAGLVRHSGLLRRMNGSSSSARSC